MSPRACLTIIALVAPGLLVAQPPKPAPAPKPSIAPKAWPSPESWPAPAAPDGWANFQYPNALEADWAPEIEWRALPNFDNQSLAQPVWEGQQLANLKNLELRELSTPMRAWAGESYSTPATHFPEPHGQDSPADSLYRKARESLNRGEYRQASDQFKTFAQRFPTSRFLPAAMYWQAFSLYRAGSEVELRAALQVLDEQRKRYPAAADEGDVASLVNRVVAALASRGDAEATARVRQNVAAGTASCDREDLQIRAEALAALVQSDPASAGTVLKRVLARRDECSAPLRRRAVYLIGREGIGGGAPELIDVAKNDPDQQVRTDAISRLAQLPGDGTVAALEQLFASTSDESVQRAVLQALRGSDQPEANRIIRRSMEREDLSEGVRIEAIRSLVCCGSKKAGQGEGRTLADADAAALRSIYDKTQSRNVKIAALEALARAGGSANDHWLMAIAKNQSEDGRLRGAALSRLQRSDVSIDELAKLYDGLTERELRSYLVNILGNRDEPAATDKLIEIAKSGTDPAIRRMAISVLARKKDPRTTKLLLDLVEKP